MPAIGKHVEYPVHLPETTWTRVVSASASIEHILALLGKCCERISNKTWHHHWHILDNRLTSMGNSSKSYRLLWTHGQVVLTTSQQKQTATVATATGGDEVKFPPEPNARTSLTLVNCLSCQSRRRRLRDAIVKHSNYNVWLVNRMRLRYCTMMPHTDTNKDNSHPSYRARARGVRRSSRCVYNKTSFQIALCVCSPLPPI